MRYVMVPVPSEFVLDVMRWVLFRAPEDDANEARDGSRLRNAVERADDLTRGILTLVATATHEDRPLRLTDVAAELDHDADTIRTALRRLNTTALGGGRELVKISNEASVGPLGKHGKVAYLMMRPEHARMIRAHVTPADAPSA